MKLAKKTRKRLHEAQGKPIEITWPASAPEPHAGKRYPVYGEDGKLFTIRVERSKRRKYETKAIVRIDDDPIRLLYGLSPVHRDDGTTETEPERVDVRYEGLLAQEANQRNAILRAEATRSGKAKATEASTPTSSRSERAKARHVKALRATA